MRNTKFKSSIAFHPTKTGSALKESEWAISPLPLAAGLAQVSRKKVEFFFQHHLQNDVFAASVALQRFGSTPRTTRVRKSF